MTKKTNSKQKLLVITVFLLILLISVTAYSYVAPIAHSEEPTILEKGTSILNSVAGLDLAKYTVTAKEHSQNSYFEVVPEENLGYTLNSNTSKLDILCTFANGKLHILHVLEAEGLPSMTRTYSGVLDMAKSFLDDYTLYSENTFYAELSSTLNTVDANKNSTMISGNVKLQVNATTDYTTFSWTYTVNGIGGGDKCVALGYKDGFLKYFVDTWDLYPVGSTEVNLSEEEAIAIAIERARSFSWKVVSGNDTFEVKDFNVTKAKVTQLVFCSSIGAYETRGDYQLILFPMWRIGVGLDKFYPGNVYGIYVDIWADTKQVRLVHETFSTLPPELIGEGLFDESDAGVLSSYVSSQSNLETLARLAFLAIAVVVLGTVPIWLSGKKNSSLFSSLPKLRSSRINVGLLCILLSSMMLLVPISKANAEAWRATIWGSTSESPPHIENEVGNQTAAANYLENQFADRGYFTSNYQGDDTYKTNVLAKIEYIEENSPRAAFVYFDHGIGNNKTYNGTMEWHYHFYDSNGITVFDDEIHPKITGKTFFALINTCLSGKIDQEYIGGNPIGYPTPQGMSPSGHAVGMPFAFTNRTVCEKGEGFSTALNMSIDGYGDADDGDFCFIGFPWGSAALEQKVDDSFPSVLYRTWVESFFWYTLNTDVSVISALNSASLMCFSSSFSGTALHNNFNATWDGGETYWSDCTMAVYGNGDLHLYPPTDIHIEGWFYIYGGWVSGDVPVKVDDELVGSTAYDYLRVAVDAGYHTVEVPSEIYQVPFWKFDIDGEYYYDNPLTVYVEEDTTLWMYALYSDDI